MSIPATALRRGRPLRLAHRGDWRRATENSLAALVAGARAPHSDGVEFDVRLSRDGVPVVIHDGTLERVQGLPDRVDALSAAELDARGVPALADVLAALPRRAFLDVELKVVAGLETIEVLAGGRGRDLERAVISSFEPAALRHVAQLAPAWPRWLNVPWIDDAILDAARDLDVQGLSVEWHAITPRSAARVRAAGLDLAAWTVRRRDTFTRLGTLGVAAICVEGAALDG